jgi:hypothetical protein
MLLSVFVGLDGEILAFPDSDRSADPCAPNECIVQRAIQAGTARVGNVRRTPCESIGSPEYKSRVAAAFLSFDLAESVEDRPYDCWWWQVEATP